MSSTLSLVNACPCTRQGHGTVQSKAKVRTAHTHGHGRGLDETDLFVTMTADLCRLLKESQVTPYTTSCDAPAEGLVSVHFTWDGLAFARNSAPRYGTPLFRDSYFQVHSTLVHDFLRICMVLPWLGMNSLAKPEAVSAKGTIWAILTTSSHTGFALEEM